MKNENVFQKELIKKLKSHFKEIIILKNDCNYNQGIPDLIFLIGKQWGMLEVKKNKNSTFRPNQKYWLKKLNDMSWARVIYPENEKEVLHEIKYTFK